MGIEKLFFNALDSLGLKEINLFLVRQDGIVLTQHGVDTEDAQHVGALVGGVWQAASALSMITKKTSPDYFRLSFDTSSEGVYVLPVNVFGERHFLAGLYSGQNNPGQLKNNLRYLAALLEDSFTGQEINHQVSFEDITDDEIDNIFSFVGN